MNSTQAEQMLVVLVVLGFLALVYYKRPWRPSSTAHGSAGWASRELLKKKGMLGGDGLLLGRTPDKQATPIRIRDYVHLMIAAPPGAGKFVSFGYCWLQEYKRGSLLVNDPKGEAFKSSAGRRRELGQTVVRLDPFGVCGEGADTFNPLDLVRDIDDARAMAEAMVVRTGMEHDPYWNDQAANVLTALIAYAAACPKELRTLSTVRGLLTTPGALKKCGEELQASGGLYARLGGVLLGLEGKEGASVVSSCQRHTTFLDSPKVLPAVESGWDARTLLTGNVALYLVLPAHQMEAQSRWLRLVISCCLRLVGQERMAKGKELLALLDEAGQLGHMQPVEQGLTLLRGAGLRLVLMFQSLGQLKEVFKEKESVALDSCDLVVFGTQSLEQAKRVSEMLGSYTESAESYAENSGTSRQYGGFGQQGGVTVTAGSNVTTSTHARNLLTPDEILTLPGNAVIAFLRSTPPILAARVISHQDPLFRPGRASVATLLKVLMTAAVWAAAILYWMTRP